MVSSREGTDEFASDELQKGQSPDDGSHMIQQIDDSGIHISQNDEVTPVTTEKSLLDTNPGAHISQLNKEGSVSSVILHKVLLTPGTGSSALQSGQEGRTSIVREKALEDGYHWRKYGQKLVKGNEFIRSYYKCTHPSCQVKKQLERSRDGQVADINYFGQHDHPKPEHNLPPAAGLMLSVVEERGDEPSSTGTEDHAPHPLKSTSTSQILVGTTSEDVKGALSESNKIRDEVDNDDDLRPKRQKKGNCNVEPAVADKPTNEQRHVIQTLSEVDIVNDGYRWRKYGQKLVKGNPNPRSYYRCSSPGCPVKKHVERASHDPKVVITSYEGQHDHDMPPSRTVTHNATGLSTYTTNIHIGESGIKSGGSDGIVHKSLDPSGNSEEQLNSELTCKSEGNGVSGSDMVIHSGSGDDNGKSNVPQNGKSSAIEGSDAAVVDTVVNASSVSGCRSIEQHDRESRNESKVNCAAYSGHTITPGPETNPNEQHMPNAEPVQS
ncbi:WRKY transcription factor 1 isoform X2 [Hevea brasiliensis]|uniref:WRKY transcription factor 1 isoform X2 n=1 Tax=Hevea brasiliensis TaxID=3981 RepID=UPI0025EA6301|nr:WRKY transcription factor 1 isoform X2 [Hevea brasiliensis]